jgi:hypothetical protein
MYVEYTQFVVNSPTQCSGMTYNIYAETLTMKGTQYLKIDQKWTHNICALNHQYAAFTPL